jgi:hypothetical protein
MGEEGGSIIVGARVHCDESGSSLNSANCVLGYLVAINRLRFCVFLDHGFKNIEVTQL